jgi:hypothetical protein
MIYVEPQEEHFAAAKEIIADGWYQVSRRFRTVARLPDGMTGIEALARDARKSYGRDSEEWANMLGERSAGDHWLRCFADKKGCWKELDQPTFDAFRKLGGRTYH